MVGTLRRGDRQEAARATVTPVPSARKANRRHAPGRQSINTMPPQGDRTRPGAGEKSELHVTAMIRKNLSPSRSSSMALMKSPAGSGQHLCLRLLAGKTGWSATPASTSMRPVLAFPVPQMGEQLVNFFRFLDVQSPVEQVIDVPKIPKDSIQQRLVDRDSRVPQMAEQLVEVPTVLSLAVLAEQIVDIPVPRGRGVHGGRQGFHPRQSSTASVPEQTLDTPAGGGLQDFFPVPHSAAPSAFSRGEPNRGFFFAIFSREKCRGRPAGGHRSRRGLQLIHACCSSR